MSSLVNSFWYGGTSINDFIIEVTTTGASESFTFPFYSTGTFTNCYINFGDGGGDKEITVWNDLDATNVYAIADTYTVTISADSFTGIKVTDATTTKDQITKVVQWGAIPFDYLEFFGCANMTVTATDVPTITSTTLQQAFRDCSSITTIPNIGDWDVSNVTTFSEMFSGATLFNSSIDNWTLNTTSNVDLSFMFQSTTAFNQPLNSWNVTKVNTTHSMFRFGTGFNQPLSNWVTTSLTATTRMFDGATSFNQDISNFDLSNVTDTSWMFLGATSFNNGGQPLENLDLSSTTFTRGMFQNADAFNVSVANWTFNNPQSFSYFFRQVDIFNQSLANWDITNANDFGLFFQSVTSWTTASYDATIIAWATLTPTYTPSIYFPAKYTESLLTNSTNTSLTTNKLVDSGATFVTTGVSVNDVVYILGNIAKVTAVDSETQLSLNVDIFVGTGVAYRIQTSSAAKAKEKMINTHGWSLTDNGYV